MLRINGRTPTPPTSPDASELNAPGLGDALQQILPGEDEDEDDEDGDEAL